MTSKVRAAIQPSDEPASVLAERFGTAEQTVHKWQARDSVLDRRHSPHRPRTTLTPAQEAAAVALRGTLSVSIDDLLAVVREFLNPNASCFGLDRCLRRHGVGNLRDLEAKSPRPKYGIEHRLAPPRHPQTNGMVGRFNGRMEAGLQSHHFRSREELEMTLDRHVPLYNRQLPQSALGSKTPMQAMKDWHWLKPELFKKRPCHLPGRNTYTHRTTHRSQWNGRGNGTVGRTPSPVVTDFGMLKLQEVVLAYTRGAARKLTWQTCNK